MTFYQSPSGLFIDDTFDGATPYATAPDPAWVVITEAAYNTGVAGVTPDRDAIRAADLAARQAVYHNLKASVHTSDWTDTTVRAVANYPVGS